MHSSFWSFLLIHKDGSSSLTSSYVMLECVPSPARLIKTRPNDKASEYLDGGLELVYLMAYQDKLIEEGSWHTSAEHFHYFNNHITRGQPIEWRIEWVYLMIYQTKLIEEGSWRIFAESFHYIHIHMKMWWSIDSHGWSNEFIWWFIKPSSLEKDRDVSLQNLSIVSTFISKCGDWIRIKKRLHVKVNFQIKPSQNSHPPLWSPAYLCSENPEGTLRSSNASNG